jgi:hypothetical protein
MASYCHSLFPKRDGTWLSPPEVVAALQLHFLSVSVSATDGIKHALKVLQRMEQLGIPRHLIDQLERTYEDSLAVVVSDLSLIGFSISFVVTPENSIKIYHELDRLPLVERCKEALGYEMERL